MSWTPGKVVVWRQVWRGTASIVMPARVVEDSDDLLLLQEAP